MDFSIPNAKSKGVQVKALNTSMITAVPLADRAPSNSEPQEICMSVPHQHEKIEQFLFH
jgi:hypothetical protein